MQLEQCCKVCVGPDIKCFIPYKEVQVSEIVPLPFLVSLTDQDFDLTLKSLSNIKE